MTRPDGPDGGPIARCPARGTPRAVWAGPSPAWPPTSTNAAARYCTAVLADAGRLHPVVHRMSAEPVEPPPRRWTAPCGRCAASSAAPDVLTLASPSDRSGSPPGRRRGVAHAVDRFRVRARSCRISQAIGTEIGGGPRSTITVAARYGVWSWRTATARARQTVLTAAEQALGLSARRVDIEVVDIFPDGPAVTAASPPPRGADDSPTWCRGSRPTTRSRSRGCRPCGPIWGGRRSRGRIGLGSAGGRRPMAACCHGADGGRRWRSPSRRDRVTTSGTWPGRAAHDGDAMAGYTDWPVTVIVTVADVLLAHPVQRAVLRTARRPATR